MKLRLVLAVTMITIGAGLTAGAASADMAGNPSCGGNNPTNHGVDGAGLTHHGNPNTWSGSFDTLCGTNATVEYEVQVSTDGGSHYTDLAGTDTVTNLGSDGTRSPFRFTFTGSGIPGCHVGYIYRTHAWAAPNADLPSALGYLAGGC